MKKLYLLFIVIFSLTHENILAQTYQLSGNPINTTGWSLVPSAVVDSDFIRLTTHEIYQVGGIKLNDPINLNYCNKWKVEFDFKIDGPGSSNLGQGDGLAFWYIANPPVSYLTGDGLGIPNNATGLMVGFDTFNNYTYAQMSKVHVLYGTNNGNGNIEMNNTPGSTYHSNDLTPTLPFTTGAYRHVEVNGEIDPNNIGNWIITINIDNQQIVSQSFQPSGSAANMSQGYFGFSASTGGAISMHSIKNVKIYVDKINLLQNTITTIKCISGSSNATVDLTSFNSQLVSSPSNYIFTYYLLGNSIPINTPDNFQYSNNTTIKVIIKDPSNNLCDAEAQIQLNTTTAPLPIINTTSTNICPGGNITLTSSNTTGNTWSTGATTPSITVTAPGTYTLVTTNGNCTSPTASVTITAATNPNVQITGNLVLCDTSTQIIATSTGTGNLYTWSNGATGNTISVAAPGTYTVTVTTPANCTYQKSVTVTQGVVPAVQNAILSICSDTATATFNLTSAQNSISTTLGVTFDYYLNQADAVAGNTNTISNPAAHISGNATVYVRVKSSTCSKVANLQLTVNQKPVAVITASASVICNNGSITLTSNYATGNTWSTGQTTQSITVNTPGVYTLTNNNGLCTSDATSVTISSSPNPNVQIAGNLTFCEGSSTVLTASATGTGNTFSWSNGVTGTTNTVTASGTYTVTVTTPLGCQYQSSATVTMDPAISVNIAAPAEINCANTQITLNASGSTFPNGSAFLWTASGGGTIVSGANTLTPVVNNAGTYTLKITSPFGCTKQSSVTVVKNITSPTITLNASSINICKGDSVVLTASGAASYTWTGLSGNGSTQTVSPTSTTTYTVTGIGSNGCPAQTTTSITINVVPAISASLPNVEVCQGDNAILDAGAGQNYSYSWNTGATTQTISTAIPGTYTVTINNGSCSKVLTAVVSYIKTPEITGITYENGFLTINVKNPAGDPLEYSIDGGVTWQSYNIFKNVLRNTQYSIRVRKRGVLCDTHTEYYTFLMNNTITPNSDGINDNIDFSIISKFGNFKGNIFDKYGKVVFEVSSKNPVWNGKYVGMPLPTDTYWYSLSWTDQITKQPVQLSGWILLKNRE